MITGELYQAMAARIDRGEFPGWCSLPLMHQPGERWQYNVASLILGVLVARAAGQGLDDVFAERLCAPLAMVDTGFSMPAEQAHRLPGYYLTGPGPGTAQPPARRDLPPRGVVPPRDLPIGSSRTRVHSG